MSGRVVVAEGTHSDGLTWVIWARRHEPREGDLLSMIRVTDAAGRILYGDGRAGPPLPPGHVLNVTSGGSDEGPRTLLARVDPRVRRLELKIQGGFGAKNEELERFDLRFYQGRWEESY
jgi:hypothetical protein